MHIYTFVLLKTVMDQCLIFPPNIGFQIFQQYQFGLAMNYDSTVGNELSSDCIVYS